MGKNRTAKAKTGREWEKTGRQKQKQAVQGKKQDGKSKNRPCRGKELHPSAPADGFFIINKNLVY